MTEAGQLARLTHGLASNGHAVGPPDGWIRWSGAEHGFREEAALYDKTFQQSRQSDVMEANGSNKRLLTDSRWEDPRPMYIDAKWLRTVARAKPVGTCQPLDRDYFAAAAGRPRPSCG